LIKEIFLIYFLHYHNKISLPMSDLNRQIKQCNKTLRDSNIHIRSIKDYLYEVCKYGNAKELKFLFEHGIRRKYTMDMEVYSKCYQL